jgi:hypothetical protein
MRTSLRHFAVVVPLILLFALGSVAVRAQFKINRFDTATADSLFAITFNATANNAEPKPYHVISDDPTVKREGAASLKSVWRVHTTESWGGLNMLSATNPTPGNNGYRANNYRAMYGDSSYLDWGSGTHLSLWYNNQNPSNAVGNGVQMRFHIYEAGEGSTYYTGDSTDYEDWYFQSAKPLNDSVAGWHELIMPLVDQGLTNSPNDAGFCLTGWSGKNHNNKLDWDKIIGYTIEWTAGKVANDTASGIVFYDDLRMNGLGSKTGYEAMYKFNNFTKDTADFKGGWNNGGLSQFNFFEEKTDTLMGSSVLGVDWKVNVKESWGGGANRQYDLPAGTFFPDLSAKSQLQFYIKVVEPLTCSKGAITNKITMRFILWDYSDGQEEHWYTVVPVRMDSIGVKMGWQQVKIPLDAIQNSDWGQLKPGRFNTPQGAKDGVMGLNKIGNVVIEFSASADAPEPFAADLVYSGKMLLSAIIPSGFRETDKTPPAPVTGIQSTPSTFSNIITWSDVPGEVGATYTVYASEKSFTTTDAAGVEDIAPFRLPTGAQLQTHLLRSPVTNQNVSLYYGVTATDKAGNTNQPSVVGPFTTMAKGVPTFSKTGPSPFVADGNLTEWAGISQLLLSVNPATPTAYAVTNTKIDGDADLKVIAYLAMDATNLYVAFDVDDDVVSIDTTCAQTWFQDSPDLFIGLYDWRGKHHTGYGHGTTPDYHLRFCQNKIIVDNAGGVTLMPPGPNYSFTLKQLTTGYVVEARIPWTAFKALVPADSLFSPVEGMRIPIDFEINDNDTPGNNQAREGQMDYSAQAQGSSYADVWRWTYTWIGAKSSTLGVDDQPGVVNEYALQQNYPNPFNPSTIISYSIAQAGPVTVKVFDVLGREVATLVNGEQQNAGRHQVTFNTAAAASSIASGVYFYKIESGSFRDVKKMMLLK